jgi:hypothetical protein
MKDEHFVKYMDELLLEIEAKVSELYLALGDEEEVKEILSSYLEKAVKYEDHARLMAGDKEGGK